MARNTISTFTYTIPIDIKWKCSKCGYNNEVSQTISIEGEASTRSPRKKDLDLNNEKAKSIALDEVDKWTDRVYEAGASRNYYNTKLDCKCAHCDYRESWSTEFQIARRVIYFLIALACISCFIGIMCLCYGAWLYTLLVMPLLILIFISILLDKINRRNTNELTKMLDEASLPTIYYNEKIISCPKPVINSEKYASSYDLTRDIHNKNTDEIQSKLSKISDNIASQNPSILEFMEQEKFRFIC